MKTAILIAFLALPCSGMDWTALGMIESGNDDYAVGRAGERSRYQISQKVVKEWHFDAKRLTNADYALDCAKKVMEARIASYCPRPARPSDFYLALLWNCPAHRSRPSAIEADYAQRFSNLAENNRK